MATRRSWATSAAGGWQSVEDGRWTTGSLWTPGASAVQTKTGFRPGPGAVSPGSVYATATPDANVHVAPFQLVMQAARGGVGGGTYLAGIDATHNINILSTPAHASQSRRDLIVAQQNDQFYGDADSLLTIRHVVGTPSGTPVDPVVSGSPDYVTLARVTVRPSTTTILATDITDLRPAALWTVAVGGVLPVATQAVRDSLAGRYDGMAVYRQDRDWVEVYDGTAWRVQGIATVTSVGNLSLVTDPVADQLAMVTADATLYRYSGSAWVASVALGGTTTATRNRAFYESPSGQSFANATWQRVNYNAPVFTCDGWSGAIVSGGTAFTCARAGAWDIRAFLRYASAAGSGTRALAISLDGTPSTGAYASSGTHGPAGYWTGTISVERDFSVGDKFAVYGYQDTGTTINADSVLSAPWVKMRWLGPKAT